MSIVRPSAASSREQPAEVARSRSRRGRTTARRAAAAAGRTARARGRARAAGRCRWGPSRRARRRTPRCRPGRAAARPRRRPTRRRSRTGRGPRWMSSATRTLSRTVSDPNASSRWKVRPMPRRARRCTGIRVTSRPSRHDPARGRRLQPGDHVEAGGLAGAVGADQAGDGAGARRRRWRGRRRSRRRTGRRRRQPRNSDIALHPLLVPTSSSVHRPASSCRRRDLAARRPGQRSASIG